MKVYTDGSCLGNPGRGGWGFIAVSDDGDELYRDGDFGGDRVTNNIMELTAMLKALRWIFLCIALLVALYMMITYKISLYLLMSSCTLTVITYVKVYVLG